MNNEEHRALVLDGVVLAVVYWFPLPWLLLTLVVVELLGVGFLLGKGRNFLDRSLTYRHISILVGLVYSYLFYQAGVELFWVFMLLPALYSLPKTKKKAEPSE